MAQEAQKGKTVFKLLLYSTKKKFSDDRRCQPSRRQ
jgi:hypothetical protein